MNKGLVAMALFALANTASFNAAAQERTVSSSPYVDAKGLPYDPKQGYYTSTGNLAAKGKAYYGDVKQEQRDNSTLMKAQTQLKNDMKGGVSSAVIARDKTAVAVDQSRVNKDNAAIRSVAPKR